MIFLFLNKYKIYAVGAPNERTVSITFKKIIYDLMWKALPQYLPGTVGITFSHYKSFVHRMSPTMYLSKWLG